MGKYYQVHDDEWIRMSFKKQKEQCCGCGLVHVSDYKIVMVGKTKHLYAKSKVDNRATAAVRRYLNPKK